LRLNITGFSGHIPNSTDILLAELTAIYHGLSLAIDMGLDNLVCYSDSLLSINLITVNTLKFHIYAVLLQDIKDLLRNRNFTLHHTLREGNYCADFLAKLGASSEDVFTVHPSPPIDLPALIRNDASGTLFTRA
jgi:ribonuclease HI